MFFQVVVNSVWSQIDLEKNERTKFEKSFLLKLEDEATPKLIHAGNPLPIRNK
jgi:hypothetical protein